jgi:1,4-dihydroxy-2-naphthoate octaprenyltransferase
VVLSPAETRQQTEREPSALTAARGLLRLSKIRVFQHYFGLALAWLMLSHQALGRPGATPAMLLFLLGSIAIVACACSADDLAGYRNGSDAMNYNAKDQLRDIRSKPLLSGAVTEGQATAFCVTSGVVAVAAGLAAFWQLGWHAPVAAYVLYLVGFVFSVQYSAGLRISYHRGGAELLLCLSTAAGLVAPYLAVERHWSAPAVIEALLLGLWLVMVSSCSNVNDAEGDRSVGRRTLAVSTSAPVFKTAMVLFFVISCALIVALTFSTGGWPLWSPLAGLPVIAVHARQLYLGPVRGEWLRARRLGLIAYNLGFLGIAVPTFFAFH